MEIATSLNVASVEQIVAKKKKKKIQLKWLLAISQTPSKNLDQGHVVGAVFLELKKGLWHCQP